MAANPLKGNEMMKKAWLVRARTGLLGDIEGDTHVRSGPGIWKKKPRQGKDWLDV
jgi:hypothetical protein